MRASHIKMLLMFAIISAPVIASYIAYYFYQPVGRSNYGALIQPQSLKALPLKAVASVKASGLTPVQAAQPEGGQVLSTVAPLKRRWLMLTLGPSACDAMCARRLLFVRQVRWTTGVDMERIERVWMVTDEGAPAPTLMAEHQGLYVMRVDRKTLESYFKPEAGADLSEHIYLVDPLGNLMMRFPKDVDPDKMKRDIVRLLRASRVG